MIVLITPVLNGARFISAMLTSIAAQTDKGWVHYIMDGGSTDGTQDIIRAAMAGELDGGEAHAPRPAVD